MTTETKPTEKSGSIENEHLPVGPGTAGAVRRLVGTEAQSHDVRDVTNALLEYGLIHYEDALEHR